MSINVNGRRAIGGSSMHNYSTDEQVVGTWIDGSAVYEKTIFLTKSDFTKVSSGVYTFTSHGISNIDRIIELKGIIKTVSYGYCVLGSISYPSNNSFTNYYELENYYQGVIARDNGGQSVLENETTWTCVLTYRYTKTS